MCRRAREYLEARGYAYRYLVVDLLPPDEKDRLKERLTLKHGTRVSFPSLVIDDSRVVLGFFPKTWDTALA